MPNGIANELMICLDNKGNYLPRCTLQDEIPAANLARFINDQGLKFKGGTSVPFTLFAEMDGDLLWNSIRDVHLGPQAGHAHVGWVRGNRDATCAAKAVKRKHFFFLNPCVV